MWEEDFPLYLVSAFPFGFCRQVVGMVVGQVKHKAANSKQRNQQQQLTTLCESGDNGKEDFYHRIVASNSDSVTAA